MSVRTRLWIFVVGVLISSALPAEDDSGSVCLAPVILDADRSGNPSLYCAAEKVSLKIDARVIPPPIKKSVKIVGLDPRAQHRVAVLCDRKPQQSFTFRFSEFKSTQLCVFLNDLYKTAQLWEPKQSPWCRCK